jgi:hypothetical protein
MSSRQSEVARLRLRVPIITTLLIGILLGARGALERNTVKHLAEPEAPRSRSLLPFSATDVTNCLSVLLDQKPIRGQGGAVVFEGNMPVKPDRPYRVVVITEHNELVITFSASGATGMGLAREFFEAPLFTPSETERLCAMIDHANGAPSARLSRFSIAMKLLAYSDDKRLTVRFLP